MKKILTLLLTFIYLQVFASENFLQTVQPLRHSLGISSTYYFESNAITNSFALAYFKNEFIDNAKKDVISKNLSALNRFGAGFTNEIKFSQYDDTLFGLKHSSYSISLRDVYHLNCRFSNDAFELYFRGNKAYAGKETSLSDFIFRQLVYRQINFTFGHTYSYSENKFGYTAGLNLNFGRKLLLIEAPSASIYTANTGEYIDLKADLAIHRSDSMNESFSALNGLGGSIDFSFFWKNKKNDKLSISAENFGFIHWNDQSSLTRADTSFRFEGIDISDVFLLSDTIRKPISLDSSLVEPYLTERTKKKFSTFLPALFKLNYLYVLKPGKIDLEAGISYLMFAETKPVESLAFIYSFLDNQRISLKASYGGYTGFRAGISFDLLLFNRWMLTLRSDQLSGVFMSQGNAQGAFVSLSAYF